MAGERKGFCFTMQQEEIWKDIKGYEGCYQVSSFGRVRSLERDVITPSGRIYHYKGQLITNNVSSPKNYVKVTLCNGFSQKKISIHRLVAEVFVPNPDCLPEIDHIDGDRHNNIASNLRWVNRKENMANEITKQKMSLAFSLPKSNKQIAHTRSLSCLNMKPVAMLDDNGNIIKRFESIKQAAMETKSNPSCIGGVCLGRYKTANGNKWKYIEI